MKRDAEKLLQSALATQPMLQLYLELAKVFLKLDQPRTAIEIYSRGLTFFIGIRCLKMFDCNRLISDSRRALVDYWHGLNI